MGVSETITKYLSTLGIEPEATSVYLAMHKSGHSSALKLARATGISRTQTYRHLESLQKAGLVSAENLGFGTLYRPLPIENIEALLASREAETAALRRNLGAMTHALQQLAGASGSKASTQHFYGAAGLKQANWNLTKADGQFRVFEAAHISAHLDKAFARRLRERFIERGLTSYDLTNATSVAAKEVEPYDPSRTFLRHIDPGVLTISFEMYVYNDTVTLLDYSMQQPMALEIHHSTLKTMMQQLFDAMWQQATPLEIT
ncbi:MAG: TrmB family transcriptional regulator [Candidatus Saccharimonadales bacterium]